MLPAGASVALRRGELASWRFVPPERVPELVPPGLAVRVAGALAAMGQGRLVEVEDGVVLPPRGPVWVTQHRG